MRAGFGFQTLPAPIFPYDFHVPASHVEFTYDSSSRITAIKDRAQAAGSSTDRWELAQTTLAHHRRVS